jgi:hypothetical protein
VEDARERRSIWHVTGPADAPFYNVAHLASDGTHWNFTTLPILERGQQALVRRTRPKECHDSSGRFNGHPLDAVWALARGRKSGRCNGCAGRPNKLLSLMCEQSLKTIDSLQKLGELYVT